MIFYQGNKYLFVYWWLLQVLVACIFLYLVRYANKILGSSAGACIRSSYHPGVTDRSFIISLMNTFNYKTAMFITASEYSLFVRFLLDPNSFFFDRFSSACLHFASLILSSSSLHVMIQATLRSRLNSCTGFRKASLVEGSKMCDVFSVCNVKPSGIVIELSVAMLAKETIEATGWLWSRRRKGRHRTERKTDMMASAGRKKTEERRSSAVFCFWTISVNTA